MEKKNWIVNLTSYHIQNSQMDHRPKYKNCNNKISRRKHRRKSLWYCVGKDYQNMTQTAWIVKYIYNKMDFIKIKNFHSSKDIFKREKTSHRLGRSICKIPNWWRTCFQDNKKANNAIKKWAKDLKRYLLNIDIWLANMDMTSHQGN